MVENAARTTSMTGKIRTNLLHKLVMALRKNPERKNLESKKRDNLERNNLECKNPESDEI